MKVLQIVPSFQVGGAEVMCKTLSVELKKAGHQVQAISLYDGGTHLTDELLSHGIPVHFLHKKSGFDFSMRKKIQDIITDYSPDIIHTHLNVNKYVSLGKCQAKRFHTIHNMANKETFFPESMLQRHLFQKHLSVPVALNRKVQKSIVDFYGLEYADVPIVFNGIRLDAFIPKSDYHVAGDFTLIHVACFRPQKNHRNLVEGFAKALKTNEHLHLLLVGDGELYGDVKQAVERLGLSSKIEMPGCRSDIAELLHKADCFVLPSNYEGMPISIIEAMASALPVIATAVGSVPDIIVHNENGYLCDATPNSICEAILKLAGDEMLRRRLGENARMSSMSLYSAQEMARNYSMLYERQG